MAGLFGGKVKTTAAQPPTVDTLRVQRSAFGGVVPILYGTNRLSGNVTWYGDFKAIAHTEQQSAGGKGGGGGAPATTSYTYTASFLMGLCEGRIAGINSVWQDKAQKAAGSVISAVFYGQTPQAPWPYLLTNHPDQALGYGGLAYLGFADFDLGSSANLPNLSFEVQGPLQVGGGIVDADPSACIGDFLGKAAFPAAYIGDLTLYRSYVRAMGLFLSPVLDQAQAANQTLQEWADTTNSAFVWSGGQLTVKPYGDTAVTGNGATYAPNLTPLYDLGDDDFIVSGAEDPIAATRPDLADAYNRYKVEFVNRANQYNAETITVEDAAHIDIYGIREAASLKAHHITSAAVAQTAGYLLMWRQLYVRAQYAFRLGWRHCLLEPMDLVTLTDPGLGLDRTLVRIIEVEEDETGLLSVKAEEMPGDIAGPALFATQGAAGYAANYNATAPDANAPILFDAPVELSGGGLEVWMAVSGPTSFGGCDVWLSFDGSTYKKAGTVHGGARMGVSTIPLPAGQDPDLTHILGVDISMSGGQLLSGTQSDADLYHTACWLDGEIVAYETATLDDTGKYSLSYLRRGGYGTTNAAHAAGAGFARLDDAIFRYAYTKEQIGKTVHVKLAAFNPFQGGGQDLSGLTAYSHVIAGPPVPPVVPFLAASQNGNVVVFSWGAVSDFALEGYDIRYGAQGVTIWDAMTPLTESTRGTEMTNAAVPPGAWTFAIRARDIAGQLSPAMATADLTVVNKNSTVATFRQDAGWNGTLTGLVRHWTGVLVPDSTKAANLHTNAELFEQFVPYPVASAVYETPVLDIGFDDVLRVFSAQAAALGRGASGTPGLSLSIDYWSSTQSDPNSFAAWSVGFAALRYLRARLTLDTAVRAVITAFALTVDREPSVQSGDTVAIAAAGSAIAFPIAYHSAPRVQATVVGSSALIATATNITAAGFTAHVFDTAGADVGGTINWDAQGI